MNDREKKPGRGRRPGGEAEEATLVEGRNAVTELLRSGRPVDKLFVAEGTHGRVGEILALARTAGVPVTQCDRRKLDHMSQTGNHQGVIAQAAAHTYASLDDLFQAAEDKGEAPLFVVCDGIEDPHNLGAILRSAEAAGAHGVIIPKRRAVGLTGVVARASAGAIEHILVHKAVNLAAALEELKARGVWIYGADMEGEPWCGADLTGPLALVVGSEGFGMSRLVRESCDFILSLPMKGNINSLNASVACGVLAYEAARQRAHIPAR